MAYYDENGRGFDEASRSQGFLATPTASVLAAGLLVLLAIGVYKLPDLRRQWLESDPRFLLQMREVEARAEADAHFRRREADLKAESEAMAARLEKRGLPITPVREVVAKAGASVVNVEAGRGINFGSGEPGERGGRQNRGFNPFDMDLQPTPSEGSGVIYRLDDDKKIGYVLTNHHVVRDATQVWVTLQSGRRIPVNLDQIYVDKETDLAVLRFDASNLDHLVVAEFADSDAVEVGDAAVAIGSPFGLKQSVTAGIVSAIGRSSPRENLADLIQTDAAINPGNSGGPLLDLKGRVIGINSMIYTRNGVNQGIGFAVPSNTAKWVAEQLIQEPHRVSRGYVGIFMDELSEDAALKLGVRGGVIVGRIAPDSPADHAGLRTRDVIIRYNRVEVTSFRQLLKMVIETPPGTLVAINVLRFEEGKAQPMSFNLTVGERPPR